jgi:hypothetical protein
MSGLEREDPNRPIREHLERTRRQLAGGRARLAKARETIEETNRHIASMSEWIGETERALGEERARRQSNGGS